MSGQASERRRSGPIKSIPVGADIKRDADFDCPEEFGYYPHPSDCTLYYVCVFGGALLESCTGGLMYRYLKNYIIELGRLVFIILFEKKTVFYLRDIETSM